MRALQLSIFVYGTLCPGGSNYPIYLAGRTLTEHAAHMTGAVLYTEGIYPYLVITDERADTTTCVHGMLITIRPHLYTRTLALLDDLEDYQPNNPHSLYERTTHTVQTFAGPSAAWVYIAGPPMLTAIRTGKLTKVLGGRWEIRR